MSESESVVNPGQVAMDVAAGAQPGRRSLWRTFALGLAALVIAVFAITVVLVVT
jgi:hypothetical protein